MKSIKKALLATGVTGCLMVAAAYFAMRVYVDTLLTDMRLRMAEPDEADTYE